MITSLPPLRSCFTAFAAIALGAFVCVRPPVAAAEFTAGAAAVDITPEAGAIHWFNDQPYDGVLDRLQARALVLGSGDTRVGILTLDIAEINEDDLGAIRRAVSGATAIPAGHILVNSSHTHSAPTSPGFKWTGVSPPKNVVVNEPLAKWNRQLPERCAEVAREADRGRRPVSLGIARAHVGEWLFNRRPVLPDGMVRSTIQPADPNSLPDGMRFGPVDPIMQVLVLRDAEGKSVATLFNLGCHAVSVYLENKGISADWPGVVCRNVQQTLGGQALFLQGCGGDIVPARRGVKQAQRMGEGIASRVASAAAQALILPPAPLVVSRAVIGLPLTPASSARLGRPTTDAEIQVISCGDLALVAMPGEPLTGLGEAIKKDSPFPHTLVLGYSNGDGACYVGLPGEKVKGGYEMGLPGLGSDECGGLMVATALRLLREQRAAPPPVASR